jgi:hypothetical protein
MRFDFVVGEGYCTRFVDGGRSISPPQFQIRPFTGLNKKACSRKIFAMPTVRMPGRDEEMVTAKSNKEMRRKTDNP